MVNSTKEYIQRLLPPMIQQLERQSKLIEHQELTQVLSEWTGKDILEQIIERPPMTSM